ncbi:hypothetical protein Tco_1326698 [Tanacetum coccineum]
MDMDCISDLGFLDLELLQLNVVSPLAIKSNLYVAEKLFDQWLSLPETTIGRFAERDGVANSVMISSASGSSNGLADFMHRDLTSGKEQVAVIVP